MNLKKAILFLIVLLMISGSCENRVTNKTLARKHCSTCHLFPDPSLLDKKTWEQPVLPEMAFRMGLDMSKLPASSQMELIEIIEALPSQPMVSEKEWKSITEYYLSTAPDALATIDHNNPKSLEQFSPSAIPLPISGKTMVTLIERDPFKDRLFIGTREGKLFEFQLPLTLKDSFHVNTAPSDIAFHPVRGPMVSCMGLMDPNDERAGSVVELISSNANPSVLIDSIKRPVYIQQADLNDDGGEDLLVSAFGNFTGGLYVYEKKQDGYLRHAIHQFPGTRKTITKDLNGDGLPDILALITQGDEQIALFTNQGNFKFSYRILIKFPPVYGSSFFELSDFNDDGNPDILYANGDNADYSTVLKPYHGLRIFLNNGETHFRESWFYPMYGASMTRAVDFDKDGDCDIAAISFFPDFKKNPEQGFVYLENNNGTFTPYTTELASSSRWLTIEACDLDGDQDTDLLLGALAFPNSVPDNLLTAWREKQTSLLVLTNKLY